MANVSSSNSQKDYPQLRLKAADGGAFPAWKCVTMGQLYQERKTPGNETLPILSVSIHTGVSDGSLDEDELGKRVKRSEDKSLYKRALTGDLVFNMMRAWQGAIGVVKTSGMVSPAYIVAEPNEGVYPPFMDFLFSTPQMINRIHRLSYGVTDFRLRLYWDSFVSIDCRIPQVDEQMKIAQFLSKIDQKIDAQQRLINALKSYKRGLLHAIFAREVVLPKTNSRSWATVKIGDILRILHGRDYKMQPCEIGQYPVWGTGGIITRIDSYMCDWPCVCIGRKGTIDKPIYLDSPFWAVDTLFFSKPIADNDPLFQYYLFQTINWQQYNEASGVPSLSSSTIENIYVDVPDYPSQCAISTFLASIDKRLDVATKISFLLETVKQGLIEKLFI